MYNEIFELRKFGILKILVVRFEGKDFSNILKEMELASDIERYRKINLNLAKKIITKILWQDLAYSFEFMERKKAEFFTIKLLKEFYTDDSIIYTNAIWKKEGNSVELCEWNPMTSATFDSGVIIKNLDDCCCIWVEDND